MTIIEKMEAAGRLVAFLEMRKEISVKKLIQKLNPANTENGFLLKSEDLMSLSNYLHEKVAGNAMAQSYIRHVDINLPLFSVSDIDDYEKDEGRRLRAVMAFHEGRCKEIPQWSPERITSDAAAQLGSKTSEAKKKSSAENGKKGGRPRKVKKDESGIE